MRHSGSLWQNPITYSGAVMAILSALFFVSFSAIELLRPLSNPYTGLWTFLILPAFLVIGLLLIPIGYLLERRKRLKLFPDIHEWPKFPKFDLNDKRHRRFLSIFAIGTLLVIPLIGVASYQGYEYTDSTQFCGRICHSVMSPEYTTYLNSPHARVTCAACHIGPGASWFVKAKISGVRQVFAVTFNTFSRPVPTPVENLRPARETCEQCHWPAKFFGAQLRSRVHYISDQGNTRKEIRVLVKTGGADSSMGPPSGIHWHMALSNKIEYIAADRSRQVIPWVRSTNSSGKKTIYRADGKGADDPPPPGDLRRIDCVDCHDRPTHIIQPPDRAVDISLETERINRALPFAKLVAVEALTEPYDSVEEAEAGIPKQVEKAFRQLDPKVLESNQPWIKELIDESRAIYRRNFFPYMKVNWRTHPDNIGHMIFDGCFRCHDGKHISSIKGEIRRDCTVCHEFQEPIPDGSKPNVFQQITPEHPYKLLGIHAEINCSACHTGGRAPVGSCAGCHTTQNLFRRGKQPMLPGLAETKPAVMADLDCESCHDLTKPQTSATISEQCGACHDKGYGDIIKMWKEDAASAKKSAASSLDQLQRASNTRTGSERASMEQLIVRMQQWMDQVDRAGAWHNTDFADAIYRQITRLATDNSSPQLPAR